MTSQSQGIMDQQTMNNNIDNAFRMMQSNDKNDSFNKGGSAIRISSENKKNTDKIDKRNVMERKKSVSGFCAHNTARCKCKKDNTTSYFGRDEKVDSDIFYKVRDENDHLKKHQSNLNEEIKKLTTALERVKHDVLVERRLSDRKVIHIEGGIDIEVETMKMENDQLRDKMKKMSTIIQGLQAQNKRKSSFGPKKNLINAKTTLDNQNERNEYLRLINLLREQLKISENEVKRLHSELYGPNKQNVLKSAGEYSKDLREKTGQISDIQSKYEKTQMQFETNIKILEHTKISLEEYISKYNEERRKNMDLENRISLMESNLAKLPEYVSLIEEYKIKEKALENTIKDLCENPFIKQAEERGNVYRKLQESELTLNEAQRRLKTLDENHRVLDRDYKILKEQYNVAQVDRDKYKEEALRFRIHNEEKDRHSKNFEEQLKLLGQYGEVDSNFTKILNMLKLKDDSTSWMNIDFLEKINENDAKDPVFLLKEMERLKIEKGLLGSELEKTKSLLQIQQQINEDLQKVFEEDKKIYKAQMEKLIKKCEELSKLIDIERLPKDYTQGYKSNQLNMQDLKRDLLRDILPADKLANMMSDNITEFSKDETETDFGLNENALDLYIGEGIFEGGLEKEIGFKIANMLSFVSADFYMHETQTSNLISGSKPIYNLQLSFKLNVDEHFIHFIESDHIILDIYYIKDNVQALLGKGKIPLSQIIEAESPSNDKIAKNDNLTRVIKNVCSLYYSKDNNLLIGSVHYKMRMRSPLLETIKWYRERNIMIREMSPVHDVMMKKVEKELIQTNNFTKGKIMSVTILISKGVNLKLSGAPRKMMPYVYYQFFKFDEHFTKTAYGPDALFQDVQKYDVVYDTSFHDYIEKDFIEFMVLDDSRALEVEMKRDENKTNSVNLVDNPELDDLVGVCRVPLRDLIINDLIQNSFLIVNKKNQISGELFINIFWEQIAYENEEKSKIPYETKAWEEGLVIKLADLLKHKGLNLNSAFEIFDQDNKHAISLVNFKDTLLFTLKFTSNQQELEHLTQLIFNGRVNLSKLEFYKIFAYLLPHEGPAENLIGSVNTGLNVSVIRGKEENKIVFNDSINLGPMEKDNILNLSKIEKESNKDFNLKVSNPELAKHKSSFNTKSPLIVDTNRSLKEIVVKINEYMSKTNKRTIVEVFKMFDKDGNSFMEKQVIIYYFIA